MCGIFLAIPKSNYRLNIQACEKALNYLKKRGPDWHFKKIINKKFFGQTVLSMTGANTFKIENHISKDGRYLTLFNGEINSGVAENPIILVLIFFFILFF